MRQIAHLINMRMRPRTPFPPRTIGASISASVVRVPTKMDCGPGFVRYDDGTIETRHRTAKHHCGFDTVIHGGIQAAILDEVMGRSGAKFSPGKRTGLGVCNRRNASQLSQASVPS